MWVQNSHKIFQLMHSPSRINYMKFFHLFFALDLLNTLPRPIINLMLMSHHIFEFINFVFMKLPHLFGLIEWKVRLVSFVTWIKKMSFLNEQLINEELYHDHKLILNKNKKRRYGKAIILSYCDNSLIDHRSKYPNITCFFDIKYLFVKLIFVWNKDKILNNKWLLEQFA